MYTNVSLASPELRKALQIFKDNLKNGQQISIIPAFGTRMP
jgi:hypothetical protein